MRRRGRQSPRVRPPQVRAAMVECRRKVESGVTDIGDARQLLVEAIE
jgi:hypothetical protein